MIRKAYEEISDEELRSITVAVRKRYGLDFTNYESKSLKRGFGRIISKNKMKSILDLWNVILHDKNFFIQCIDQLTINLTELFRNPIIWQNLEQLFFEHFKKKHSLKIWHAGCSTGEEVYAQKYINHRNGLSHIVTTLATDLNEKVIEVAQKGEYLQVVEKKYRRNFQQAFPEDDFSNFASTIDKGITVNTKLKKKVTFSTHNLVSDDYPEKMDIIFCRNVMIYFDEKLKEKVLERMYHSLNKDGLLIIGFYDLLPESSKQFFELISPKERVYKKR